MNDVKPFAKQNIILVVLFAAFIGAIWLTTLPANKNLANRATKNMALSANTLPVPKTAGPHQHVITPYR